MIFIYIANSVRVILIIEEAKNVPDKTKAP